MRARRLSLSALGLAPLAALTTAGLTSAGAQEVPELLFCTVESAQVCQAEGGCQPQTTLLDADLPLRITVDVPDRALASPTEEGWPVVTPMATLATTMGQTVMQGIEGGFAWSVAVDGAGAMTLTSSTAFLTISAFGTCSTE